MEEGQLVGGIDAVGRDAGDGLEIGSGGGGGGSIAVSVAVGSV